MGMISDHCRIFQIKLEAICRKTLINAGRAIAPAFFISV
jgi:hypothetical protein